METPRPAILLTSTAFVPALLIFGEMSLSSRADAGATPTVGSEIQNTGIGSPIVRDPATGRVSIARNVYSDGVNVGIGTSTPQATLDVRGAVQVDDLGGLRLMNSLTGTTWEMRVNDSNDMAISYMDPTGISTTPVEFGHDGTIVVPPDINFTRSCPLGFISVENARNQLGCIQFDEEVGGEFGQDTWDNATTQCFRNYGGRLPTTGEWRIAMVNFALAGEGNNPEWNDDAGAQNEHAVSGPEDYLTDMRDDQLSTWYRCWIPR